MTHLYEANDGRFPDDSLVLVPYPLDPASDRAAWSWLPGTVLGQCGLDEWHIVLDGRADLAEPDHAGELLYPACFRDATEIRSVSPEEWERHSTPAVPAEGIGTEPAGPDEAKVTVYCGYCGGGLSVLARVFDPDRDLSDLHITDCPHCRKPVQVNG